MGISSTSISQIFLGRSNLWVEEFWWENSALSKISQSETRGNRAFLLSTNQNNSFWNCWQFTNKNRNWTERLQLELSSGSLAEFKFVLALKTEIFLVNWEAHHLARDPRFSASFHCNRSRRAGGRSIRHDFPKLGEPDLKIMADVAASING